MYEKLESCPLCGSKNQNNFITCKDHAVSKEDFTVVKCADCNFHFTNPRPHERSLNQYYESDDYVSHKNESTNLINRIYKFARMFTLNSKLKLISKFSTSGKLLDIGCGTGHFLEVCKKAGFITTGVEPSSLAREKAQTKNLGNVHADISDLSSDRKAYDVITLWHVLEHIPDLPKFTEQLTGLLSKKGVLFIAVPNIESYDAKYYKEFWAAYDLPRHLYHFDQKTMLKYLNINGLKLIRTIPMKLDSYYVSLLSEKYKNDGKSNYIQSVIKGFKSNTSAVQNDNNFSSLIYIAKHK